MRTNLFKSINFIRRGSGANLNLFRYAAMVLVLLLGVSESAWAHGGPHYASVSVTAAPSGYGKVYLTTNSSKNPTGDEWKSTMSATWNCNDGVANETDTRDYYVHAQAESGYHFVKWSSNSSGTDSKSTANPYTYSTIASGGSGSPTANNIYAIFEANPVYTATMVVSENGTFKYTYGGSSEVTVTSQHTVQTDQNFTFTALPETGYVVYGWYTKSGNTKNYFEYLSTTIPSFALSSDCEVGVDFMLEGTAVFQIKGTNQYFKDLNEAIAACGSASKIIVPVNDGIVPAGNYTIPSNVTLLVPKNANYQNNGADAEISSSAYTTQSVFRTLTLASNAKITVDGAIEVAGTLCNAYKQGSSAAFPGNCCLTGAYGRIIMNEGSSIVLNNSSKLYAWGLILYDAEAHGSITAKSGSTVYEPFQLTDFSGGSCLDNWYYNRPANTYDFIYSQYYVQNVEVPLTFEYGATEIVQMAINPSSAQDVQLYYIGTSSNKAMFQLTSGAKLTKWYGKAKDRQMYSLSGNASINDLVISIYGYTLTTSSYRLPITNNISVNVTSGQTTINANAVLFADSEVSIAQGAELVISSGKSVWLYDKDQWGKTYDFISDYIAPLKFAWPNATYRTYSTMDDARLKVDGTITVNGSLFTTTSGAAITSTGTGVISLPNGIVTPSIDPTLHPMTKNGSRNGTNTHANIEVTPAKLRNASQWYSAPYTGDGKACEYLATAGAAAGTINYKNGHWGWMEIWKDEDGTILKAINTTTQQSGTAPSNPTKECYTFISWNTVTSTANQEVIHTATYTPTTYAISYNASTNGSETVAGGTKTCGEEFTLSSSTFTRENYVQTGWSTSDGGEKAYELGGAYTNNADITLYPFWTEAEASVTVEGEDPTYYTTVAKAIIAANGMTNPIVKILKSATITSEITVSAAMTIDLNGKTITSTLASATGVFKINASGKTVTIQDNATGGKINHTASTSGSNYLYGVNITAGSMSIESGTIYAENTGSSRAYGINTATSATLVTVSGSASIEAKSSSSFGIYTNNACNLTMTGGTFAATGSGSRGIYTKGTTELTNATITASGSDSRTIFAKDGNMTIHSGTYSATGTGSVYVIFFEAGTVTVKGGKFNGSTCEIAKRNTAYNVNLQGGVYVHETDLAAKSTTPYHVLPITSGADYDAGYRYKVAEAYTVTFNNYDGTQLQTGYVEKNVLPTYDGTPTKPSDAQYDYIFTGWDPAIVLVTANATYTATFNDHTIRSYQVRWENIDGSEIKTDQKDYGTQPSYEGTPTYSDGTGKLYVFRAWKRQSTGDEYASGDVFPYVGGAETYIAQYNVINNLDVADEQTISVDATVDVTTVHVAGKLNVSSGTLTTKDLILEGTPNSSGEILGAETVTATHAYFDFSNGAEGFKARTWYAVAVPWQVYVPVSELGGVYLKKGEGDYVQQRLGKTYDLIYYDGARRATGANKAWNYVEDDAAAKQIMYPGRAYMIYLIADADIIRFERKDGADLLITEIEAHTYGDDNTPTTLANWNGIANPATYHAYLNVGATEGRGQVYNADTKQYNLFKMNENKLVVGQPIFVQSAVDGTVVANSTTYSPSLAPRRAKEHSALTRYELYLAPSLDVATDQIIVRMSEEKEEDEYTVGQDLTKMGVSDIVPQMWIDRYDSKMCINTAIPTDDQAYYPLGISVPQNGEYDIFLDDEPDSESTLYLTYDGEVIWNLSYGFYVAHLEKGTNTHYGLRIVKTPKVATGIDNAETSGKDINVYKIIVDDKVFIIRGNQVYGIDGRLAK